MALSADEFVTLWNGGKETRDVEFKPPGPRTDQLHFAFVARAVLAMSNLHLGGWVLIGVEKDGTTLGLSAGDLVSWLQHDEVSAGLNAYADPFVQLDVEHAKHDGKDFVALRVPEFEEVPVLARKDSPVKDSGKVVVRRGACYVRPRHQPASVEVPTQTEMRELLDLAVDKALKRFLARAGAAGVIQFVSALPEADTKKFDEQLGDFR